MKRTHNLPFINCQHCLLSVLPGLFGIALMTAPADGQSRIEYPPTARVYHTDDYHGKMISDPYRWLEDDVRESDEVRDWVTSQNEVTGNFLGQIPERAAIEERLTKLWNYEKYGTPFKEGGNYYYYKNDGLQNQSVLYKLDSLDAEPEVFIDPNSWSDDGTVALAGLALTEDGKYCAYGVAEAGSDWRTWKVMEVDTGTVLDDEIKWVKFSSATWNKEGTGFFYGRYQEPEEGAEFQSLNLNQKVWFHRVGTPQSEDELVYERPDHPEWGFGNSVTDDGKYLVMTVWKGTDDKYMVIYKDLTDPDAKPVELISTFEYGYDLVGNDDTVFYFKTDNQAPRGRVVSIDLNAPNPGNWKQIIGQQNETLDGVSLVGGRFIANYMRDAKSQIKVYSKAGGLEKEVELPGIGTASGFSGKPDDPETFYSFTSFATPTSVYRYDAESGESEVIREAKVDFDPNDYVVKQEFYYSKDGVRVPMFIAHKKGLELDGTNPTLLYAYGGFNISLTPSFSISRLAWMELGGVFAMPNLRGGGEYGEDWHSAGKTFKKQNVFNDFIAAAEFLIEKKYTSSSKLAIQGGSNGGLLVGACMTQRPELYGACLPAVGVMDMLRFHKFTAGRFWVDEYGSSDDPEMFPVLLKYSPYHNVTNGSSYPSTMVTTADTDDRVVPGHSFKFAAALQRAQIGKDPVLIRIETRAGHGAGKPTSKIIEEVADQWAFLVKSLDAKVDL